MRRIILRCLYILYELGGSKDPYMRSYSNAVNSLVVILMMHIFVFSLAFDLFEYLPLGEKFFISSVFGTALFMMAAYILAIILINIFFKERDVVKIQMGEREKRIGYGILMLYVVLLFASFFIIPFIKKGLI